MQDIMEVRRKEKRCNRKLGLELVISRLIQVLIPALLLFGLGMFFLVTARRAASETREPRQYGMVSREVDGKVIITRIVK